jgi:hypothetical protein
LAKFFVIEAVAKNYRERAKKRHARGGIFWVLFLFWKCMKYP